MKLIQQMKAIIITHEELDTLKQEVSEIKTMLQKKQLDQFRNTWIEGKKVPELLGISPKTFQTWRNKRVIPFSQFGSKIYLKLEDINTLLESNIIPNVK